MRETHQINQEVTLEGVKLIGSRLVRNYEPSFSGVFEMDMV